MAAGRDVSMVLPEGVLWRRAEVQLTTRLGVFPGDRVAVLAPPERDVAASFARRLPRIRFLHLGGPDRRPFGWAADADVDGVDRVLGDPFRPPFPVGSVEALVVVFAFPLLDEVAHRRLVDVWADRLATFGKWFSLVALDGPRDPRLQSGERDLKEAGFEKVRSMRLALGRMGQTLYLQSGRWPGMEDEGEPGDDEE